MGAEDAADRAGPDPMPQAEQFALDASMPPTGVLPRQSQHQAAELVADGRPGRDGSDTSNAVGSGADARTAT